MSARSHLISARTIAAMADSRFGRGDIDVEGIGFELALAKRSHADTQPTRTRTAA